MEGVETTSEEFHRPSQTMDYEPSPISHENGEGKGVSFRGNPVSYPPESPRKMTFAETLKKTGYESAKGVSFKEATMLDCDQISISPPTVSAPYPNISLAPEYKQSLQAPWRRAIIVKLLGRSLSFTAMQTKLVALWKLCGEYSLMDLGNGFFLFKCEDDDTIDRALTEVHGSSPEPTWPSRNGDQVFVPHRVLLPPLVCGFEFRSFPLSYTLRRYFILLPRVLGNRIRSTIIPSGQRTGDMQGSVLKLISTTLLLQRSWWITIYST